MNPQQPDDNTPNPNQPQPAEVPQGVPTPQQPEQPITALPPENHDWQQPVQAQPVQPAQPASDPVVVTPAAPRSSNKLKKLLIIAGVIVAIMLLIPVFVTLVGAPKLKQASNDTAIKNDVSIIASELNKYRSTTSTYPAVAEFYDGTFKPEGVTHLNSSDAVNYVPTPESCDAKEVPCTGFTLTTKLDSGKDYTVSN